MKKQKFKDSKWRLTVDFEIKLSAFHKEWLSKEHDAAEIENFFLAKAGLGDGEEKHDGVAKITFLQDYPPDSPRLLFEDEDKPRSNSGSFKRCRAAQLRKALFALFKYLNQSGDDEKEQDGNKKQWKVFQELMLEALT